ncbi:hypothetical protein ABZ611_25935 [Streptomyces sp. NPDC007861]|uniref:hypothetical protein n=1 Tax=Streptomyces sp. NPDC007861 TaxID=3154893 RepID=UPI0033D8E12C
MSIRSTTKPRRVLVVAAMAATLALTASGCGGDDGKAKEPASSSAESKPAGNEGSQNDTAAGEQVDPNAKLAEVNGQGGVKLVINQAKRDSGGFVTIQGEIKNESDQPKNTQGWAGAESQIVATNPNSVAGATLVDKSGKKRYYILRDTDGRCLCTTGILPIQPGKSTPVFMQFPAPPEGTTELDFTLPTFATTSLKISG